MANLLYILMIFFAILGDSFYPQMIRVCRFDGRKMSRRRRFWHSQELRQGLCGNVAVGVPGPGFVTLLK